jgi:outer membrane protein OmpA-like peptidoglycan-associated protein
MSTRHFNSLFSMSFFLLAVMVNWPSLAQMQQGYETSTPSITIDRSVLQELKGYTPPPMFGEAKPPQIIPLPTKQVALPSEPTLTAPSAEKFLNHPTQNFRVLTEKKVAPPQPAQKIAPKATAKAQKIPNAGDKKAETVPKKIADKKIAPPNNKQAYKPNAIPTMPAVPPVAVERDSLPPLPSATAEPLSYTESLAKMKGEEKPKRIDTLMDAALERQMETNTEKIKEQVLEQKIATLIPTSKKQTPDTETLLNAMPQPMEDSLSPSIIFKKSKTTIDKQQEQFITSHIIPLIEKNDGARIQILSFASSPDEVSDKSGSSARRVSLARALAVRDYLKTAKIDPARIDVRALAIDAGSKDPDKVEIVFLP